MKNKVPNQTEFLKDKKIAIYKRVSTEEQNTEARQNEIIGRYLEKHGMTLEDFEHYPEKVSAYSKSPFERPVLRELLKMAQRKEIDGLIVSNVDRLSRQLMDHFELRNLFEELDFPVVVASDEERYTKPRSEDLIKNLILDGLSKMESDNISIRTKDTLDKLRENGKFAGGKIPYGYVAIKESARSEYNTFIKEHKLLGIDTRQELAWLQEERISLEKTERSNRKKDINKVIGIVPVKDEIDVIRNIFSWYKSGQSFCQILKRVKEQRPSEKWSTKKIRYILTNPFYTGHFVHNRKSESKGFNPLEEWKWQKCSWFNEKIQPPISKELWKVCWTKYQHIKMETYHYLETSFLFQDIIKCSCGNKMKGVDQRTRSKTNPSKKDGYRYYRCQCGQKVNADDLHVLFKNYYMMLPLPFEKLTNEVYDRFTRELIMTQEQISLLEKNLEKGQSVFQKLLKFQGIIQKEEDVYLEESENTNIAYLIAKKQMEESVLTISEELQAEKKRYQEMYNIYADKEIFKQVIQNSLKGINNESRLLRTIALLIVKECHYQGDNKVYISFHLMSPEILSVTGLRAL
ncbi:MAG: recombinase family protein [Bacillaceae bacterium]